MDGEEAIDATDVEPDWSTGKMHATFDTLGTFPTTMSYIDYKSCKKAGKKTVKRPAAANHAYEVMKKPSGKKPKCAKSNPKKLGYSRVYHQEIARLKKLSGSKLNAKAKEAMKEKARKKANSASKQL